ncbi:MAG: NAD(P)/FAD-dependent oxidoreductase [Pseudomonadota bacterium]
MSENGTGCVTRRSLIKTAGLAGACGLVPAVPMLAGRRVSAQSAGDQFDIAIVGGGVAGAYCAWRLQRADPGRRIVLLEQSNRIGGRLLSVRPPGIPNMVAELGGMRFVPAAHPRLVRLVAAMNAVLPDRERLQSYNFPRSDPQNLAYLRGVRLRNSDFENAPDRVPYQLRASERGIAPADLLARAFAQIVPGIDDPSLSAEGRRQMARAAVFDGAPLYDQGVWNVLMRVLSSEAREMIVQADGYHSVVSNENAVDALLLSFEFQGVDPTQRAFVGGYQRVPQSLAEMFAQAGGTIRMGTAVVGCEPDQGGFQLELADGAIGANAVILAMPQRALQLISGRSTLLQQIAGLISTVRPIPAFKVFATFQDPWWRSIGGSTAPLEHGESTTDLPLRQIYYWPRTDGRPSTDGRSMLMAGYNDDQFVGFWDALQPPHDRMLTPVANEGSNFETFVGTCSGGAGDWCDHLAPRRLVEEAARQLAEVHGLAQPPEVVDAAFRDWKGDPFGGGWHHWQIGVRGDEAAQRIFNPIDGVPLYICGEAYSNTQGWVEGALETADLVLDRFGLPPL